MKIVKKQSGYTILELVIGATVVAALSAMILPMMNRNNSAIKAQSLADQTVTYSKTYARFVINNYSAIVAQAQTNTVYLPWSTLVTAGYVPTGTIGNTNRLGQTPCAAVTYNFVTRQLQPIMFYVGGNAKAKSFAVMDATSASNQIGGAAGIYTKDPNDKDVRQSGAGVFGNHGGWFLPDSTSSIQQIQSGCGATLQNNSIVMNLAMMSEYSGGLAPDTSLHRFKDPLNPNLGDQNNTNTATTDLSLNPIDPTNPNAPSKKLFLNGNDNSGVFLQSTGQSTSAQTRIVEFHNAALAANTVQPTESYFTFKYCKSNEVGSMARQRDTNVIIQSQLQCTHNPLFCQGTDPYGQPLAEYCYLPVSDIAVTYKPNLSSVSCPFGYVDMTVPPVVTQGNPPPNFVGGKWECWSSVLGVCTNWQYVNRNECSWNNPQTVYNKTGIKSYGQFSVATGLSAVTTWGQNSNGYDCNYSGHSSVAPGIVQSITCTTVTPVIDYSP
ncbi:MAG: type II secretion system protein [Neisseriaceae bacterium]|nr:MAG: type II secretion system protein [Neisseriaceae bacterium]